MLQRLERRFGETRRSVSTAVLNTPASADATICSEGRESRGMWRNIARESRLTRGCSQDCVTVGCSPILARRIWCKRSGCEPFYAIFCGQAQRLSDTSLRPRSTIVTLGRDVFVIMLSSPFSLNFRLDMNCREYCRGVPYCLQRG